MKEYSFKAVVFDLDGVVTKTASVHGEAWKKTFDEYLKLRQERDGEPFKEFTHEADYLPFVDGKPRYEGVDSFLKSRNINLPYGQPSDSPDKETVCGIGNKKNARFREVLAEKKPEVFSSSVELIKKLKSSGIKVGVASSSKNCKFILESAGLQDLFEARVDGEISSKLGLSGKPEPDIFVKAARDLGVLPKDSVIVEDATSGVLAGRNGNFGLVLGIARKSNVEELLSYGADLAVQDLSFVNMELMEAWFYKKPRFLLDSWDRDIDELEAFKGFDKGMLDNISVNPFFYRAAGEAFKNKNSIVFFLDYDGTLTPIVDRPDKAVLSSEMRTILQKLVENFTVAIVSGRQREDVEKLVKIEGLFYAGSHGLDIKGPSIAMVQPQVEKMIPEVRKIVSEVKGSLKNVPGIFIEDKKFSVAVHYRLVEENRYKEVEREVRKAVEESSNLRFIKGKKVFEILPDIDWDKGRAVRWIIKALDLSWDKSSVVYIGDDTTDEDAFRVVRGRGTALLVSDKEKISPADFQLSSPEETKQLFEKILADSN